MKPFDLEKALAGAPVATSDGRKVTEIHFFKSALPINQVVAIISGKPHVYDIDGRLSTCRGQETMADLHMARDKKEGWVNLYHGYAFDRTPRQSVTVGGGEVFPSEEWAAGWRCQQSKEHNKNFVACVHIEWEE